MSPNTRPVAVTEHRLKTDVSRHKESLRDAPVKGRVSELRGKIAAHSQIVDFMTPERPPYEMQ